jgi:hypothetical protein
VENLSIKVELIVTSLKILSNNIFSAQFSFDKKEKENPLNND